MATSALALSGQADARFAPRESQPYRETVTQVRDDGGEVEHFTIERTIVFSHAASGWLATVTFGPAQQSSTGSVGMFARAMTALAGTTIRYRLDSDGAILSIVDEAFQWQRFVATIAALGAPDQARSQDAAAVAGALAALPTEQRRDILDEPIAPIIAAAEAERGARAASPTTISARSSQGIQAEIPGTISVTETPTTVRSVTKGEGPIAIGGDRPGRIRIERSREIDKATGLLRAAREETITDALIAGRPAHQSIVNTTTLTLLVR